MRKRTLAREYALKLLYQIDLTDLPAEEALGAFWEDASLEMDEQIRSFTEKIVKGCRGHLETIDQILAQHAENWDLKRMAMIDRNVLREAVYELLFMSDEIPPKVAINEAVNLAKKYSQEDSGKFVNGILDKINHSEKRITDSPNPPV